MYVCLGMYVLVHVDMLILLFMSVLVMHVCFEHEFTQNVVISTHYKLQIVPHYSTNYIILQRI